MVGPPVAAVLRQVKEVVAVGFLKFTILIGILANLGQSISNTLIQNIQSRAKDFESEAKSLGDTLDLAISKYDGLAQAQ
jgi:hypothetical protein